MQSLFDRPLDYGWLEATLSAWIKVEETNVERAAVRQMTREVVAICQDKRERVQRAEAFYEKYRDVLRHRERQEVLRLMAETLLYIQHSGVRMKLTEDPIKLLGS